MTASPAPVLLRGGTVFDGLGTPGRLADVLIAGGVVAEVAAPGSVDATGVRVIDCGDRYVAPGFIDAHSHSDLAPLLPGPQPFKLQQGVTTEINGNCGIGFAPADEESAAELAAALVDVVRGVPVLPGSFGTLLDRVDAAGPTNNAAYLVGHGTLRLAANGPADELRPGALERMCELAAEAFTSGAVGFSTGLIYPPGCFADAAELAALARVAARFGGVYATHMRDEGTRIIEAIDEAVGVAAAGRLRLQVSHCKLAGRPNHGRARELLDRIAAARVAGVDARGDQYPYTAAATALAALLPNAAAAGGTAAMVQRLADPAQREAFRVQAERGEPGDGLWAECTPADVLITSHTDPEFAGRTLAAVIEDAPGESAWEVACRAIARDPAAGMVMEAMAEADVQEIMASPLIGIGSDNAMPGPGPLHPRTYGTFPRLLGRYVRELGVLTWEEAIRKATSLNANQFGLRGRGTLLPGSHADAVVFDPATVCHLGTALEPSLPVTGIDTVVLAGHVVLDAGGFTGRRRGRVLRAA